MNTGPKRLIDVEDLLGLSVDGMLADEWEEFLEEEGLELLAAYRSIKDKKTRQALLDLVKLTSKDVST